MVKVVLQAERLTFELVPEVSEKFCGISDHCQMSLGLVHIEHLLVIS
jgi:hypothetical protein